MTVESIDVEERLRAVKAAAGRRRGPRARDRVVLASAGAATATATALAIYLHWRSGRAKASTSS